MITLTDVPGMDDEMIPLFLDLYLVFFAAGLAFGLIAYVLISIGYFSISRRRGIEKAWLAWIPVGNPWILGSISDHYQLETHYRTRNKRKILLWLQIILIILLLLMLIFAATAIMAAIEASKAENQYYPFVDFMEPVRDSIRDLVLLYAVMFVVALAATIVQYTALYDLYQSCCPDSCALYLVLSIFVPAVMPFLIFSVRHKDLGMRRE